MISYPPPDLVPLVYTWCHLSWNHSNHLRTLYDTLIFLKNPRNHQQQLPKSPCIPKHYYSTGDHPREWLVLLEFWLVLGVVHIIHNISHTLPTPSRHIFLWHPKPSGRSDNVFQLLGHAYFRPLHPSPHLLCHFS